MDIHPPAIEEHTVVMVTEHTSTVYNCAGCGAPAYFNPRHARWCHYGSVTTCAAVDPVAVQLPLPVRVSA